MALVLKGEVCCAPSQFVRHDDGDEGCDEVVGGLLTDLCVSWWPFGILEVAGIGLLQTRANLLSLL